MGLVLDPQVLPFLRSLPPAPKKAIRQALRKLDDDPRHNDLDLKALDVDAPAPAHYRCRVGDYRIVFAIRGTETRVARIFHRRDGYGWMERL